ncbi:MAG: type I-E CRISPR-associated endoribonuclease Cas2e [Clostridia bacterium]|nr:type I-E CRISPR-associated endoribonuclease Cas2e [Clostridia bacterium]
MIVISLTKCPPALRGDLTKWMQEIDVGVFAGHVSARVREELWQKIVTYAKDGRAIMVYSARNEQHMAFRVYNADWIPIDFDGLELMMRPHERRSNSYPGNAEKTSGYSKAAGISKAKKYAGRSGTPDKNQPERYVVVDLETTGLSAVTDRIIELAALHVEDGVITNKIERLIKLNHRLPEKIAALTGITDEMLRKDGIEEMQAVTELMAFIGDMPMVMHNMTFDLRFIRAACQRCNLPTLNNHGIDTLSLAKTLLDDVENLKLYTIAAHFNIMKRRQHRSLDDCITTKEVYDKLIELL